MDTEGLASDDELERVSRRTARVFHIAGLVQDCHLLRVESKKKLRVVKAKLPQSFELVAKRNSDVIFQRRAIALKFNLNELRAAIDRRLPAYL